MYSGKKKKKKKGAFKKLKVQWKILWAVKQPGQATHKKLFLNKL